MTDAPTTPVLNYVWLVLSAAGGVAGASGLCAWLNWRTPNWQGRAIPSSVGLGFLPVVWVWSLCELAVIERWIHSYIEGTGALPHPSPGALPPAGTALRIVAPLLTGFALLGLLDDRLGSREFSGLRGHVQALCRGKLTTGALKLLGGGAIAVWAAYRLTGAWMGPSLLIHAAVIALSANLTNLLDCRPSRALKGFGVLAAVTLAGGGGAPWLTALLVATGVYAPLDFRCRAMMGDAGSNVLGACLGVCWVRAFPLSWLTAVLVALVVIHVLAERWSLTDVIAKRPVLRWIDELGVVRKD